MVVAGSVAHPTMDAKRRDWCGQSRSFENTGSSLVPKTRSDEAPQCCSGVVPRARIHGPYCGNVWGAFDRILR